MGDEKIDVPKFIRRLMPTASEQELREATETFMQYMAIVRRIYERVQCERWAHDSRESGLCDRVKNIPHI